MKRSSRPARRDAFMVITSVEAQRSWTANSLTPQERKKQRGQYEKAGVKRVHTFHSRRKEQN